MKRRFIYFLILFAVIFIFAGCKLTPEQKVALDETYLNLKQNSESAEAKTYESTPELLEELNFQQKCFTSIKGMKSIEPPEIKKYLVVELDLKGYNCRSQKDYIGTIEKGDMNAFFIWDNEKDELICTINGDDPCREKAENLPNIERCPLQNFDCSLNDFIITQNNIHLVLTNKLPYAPLNVKATVGAYIPKAYYGQPDTKKSNTFYNYCSSDSNIEYDDERIIVDINNCDLPLINGYIYVPIIIEYTTDEEIFASSSGTIVIKKQ